MASTAGKPLWRRPSCARRRPTGCRRRPGLRPAALAAAGGRRLHRPRHPGPPGVLRCPPRCGSAAREPRKPGPHLARKLLIARRAARHHSGQRPAAFCGCPPWIAICGNSPGTVWRTALCWPSTTRAAQSCPGWALPATFRTPPRWTPPSPCGRRDRPLKPFLYGLALERRQLTAASLIDDSPAALATAGDSTSRKTTRLTTAAGSCPPALGQSLNVPAVRTLVRLGTEPFFDRLRSLGFASLKEGGDYYGYSLALGSADVSS